MTKIKSIGQLSAELEALADRKTLNRRQKNHEIWREIWLLQDKISKLEGKLYRHLSRNERYGCGREPLDVARLLRLSFELGITSQSPRALVALIKDEDMERVEHSVKIALIWLSMIDYEIEGVLAEKQNVSLRSVK